MQRLDKLRLSSSVMDGFDGIKSKNDNDSIALSRVLPVSPALKQADVSMHLCGLSVNCSTLTVRLIGE